MIPISIEMETLRSEFLESLRIRNYSPKTLKGYAHALQCFQTHLCQTAISDPREITEHTIKDYQLSLNHYAARTQYIRIQAVKRFFEYLEQTDRILLNPCQGIAMPQIKSHLPKCILSHKQVQELLNIPDLNTPKGIRDRALLEVFYSTGIRRAEMFQLRIENINTQQGLIEIIKGKGGKSRFVPLGKKTTGYLNDYLLKVRKQWTARNPQEQALWLQAIQPHQRLKLETLSEIIHRYSVQIDPSGHQTFGPHALRHSCATELVRSGASLLHVQRILGHESLETTQRYAHVAITDLKATHRKKHPCSRKRKTKATPIAANAPLK